MPDESLVKIDRYGTETSLTIHSFSRLSRHQWASHHTAATMNTLLRNLGHHFGNVASVETQNTIPTLRKVRKDLDICTSSEHPPAHNDLHQLVSHLSQDAESLNQVIKSHTATLSDIKRIEVESRQAESSLLSTVGQLKEQGKNQKREGYGTSFIGGMLLIPSFGLSKSLINEGNGMYQTGENTLNESWRIEGEMREAFSRFSSLLHSSIDIIESLSGMINSLSSDIRSLSTSETPRQLRKIRPKAIVVSRSLAKYITHTENVFGRPNFFPYNRLTNVTCDGCKKRIEALGMFYHCQTCKESVDYCVKCYQSERHPSHEWTKHSKAQYLIHGYQICNGCQGVINGGHARFCEWCNFDLCHRCTMYFRHQHPLHPTEVRWYGDFKSHEAVCDECWRPSKECDTMYQCLDCYWYFVCKHCKKGCEHPHELLHFEVSTEKS